jgi:lipid A 4'-phosphatase
VRSVARETAHVVAQRQDRGPWLAATIIATVVISALFWLYPQLDIQAARAFYDPASGFIGDKLPWLVALLKLGRGVGWLVAAAIIGVLALRFLRPAHLSADLWRRWWVTLFAVALGPGLLVNGILKAYMGRPRPVQTTLFGGSAEFMPVWTYSNGCASNCSFVSGEASFGLFLIVFAFWFTGQARIVALVLIGLFGTAVSFNRMAFGAHFLSDVLLAWCLTALVILLLDRYLPQRLVHV